MNKYKSGSGWHYQSVRHSLARRTGHAGGHYMSDARLFSAKKSKTKMALVDASNYKYGSIAWQNAMAHNIAEKRKNNVELSDFETTFLQIQDEHLERITSAKRSSSAYIGEFESFPVKKGIEILAIYEKTRNGFRHIAILMVDGKEVDRTKIPYLNRTWERYEFESVMQKLLEKNTLLTDTEKKQFLEKSERLDREEVDRKFGNIAMIAKMGEILTDTKKESNDWKKRMLKAGLPELDMPEDWNTLSEDEKGRRLDMVIKHLKKPIRTSSAKTKFMKPRNRKTNYGEKVLAQGQADDLISETSTIRVWRSRIDNSISEEKYNAKTGRWELIEDR